MRSYTREDDEGYELNWIESEHYPWWRAERTDGEVMWLKCERDELTLVLISKDGLIEGLTTEPATSKEDSYSGWSRFACRSVSDRNGPWIYEENYRTPLGPLAISGDWLLLCVPTSLEGMRV